MLRLKVLSAATIGALAAVLAALVLVAVPATAAGTATLTGSAGVSGATITVYPTGSSAAAVVATTTTDGSFTISGLDYGSYEVQFSAPGYVAIWYGGGEERNTATAVELADDTPVALDPVTLSRGGNLQGTIRIAGVPAKSAQVRVLKLLNGIWVPESTKVAYTTSTGTFTYNLSTLQPVKVYVYTGPTAYRRYRVYYGDAFNQQTATPLNVESGATVTGVDINAPASGTLTGSLANSFGGPLSGQVIVYARDHGQTVPVEMETSGPIYSGPSSGFTVGVPAGVDLTYSGSSKYFTPAFLGDVDTPDQATFTTTLPGGTRTGPAVRLPGGLGIQARLVQPIWIGSGGRPGVAGLDVTAWHGDTLMSQAVTNADGWVRLPGLSENTPDVQVRVDGDGIDTVWLRGFANEVTTDRTAASNYSLFGDTSDDRLGEFPMSYAADRRLAATGQLQVANQVRGKPMAVQLPTWSQTPDQVDVYIDGGGYAWHVATVTGDVSGVTPIDWADSWDGQGQTVYAVASKAGWQGAASSTGISRVPFTATHPPTIRGTAVPGQLLRYKPATFNTTPDSTERRWSRNGSAAGNAETYRVTAEDVGTVLRFQEYATFGSSATTTTSQAVRVLAKSALTGSAKTTGTQAAVTVKLSTPGVTKPRGKVSIAAAGKTLKTYSVTTAPASRTVQVTVKKTVKQLTVTYTGSATAAPATKTIAIRRP